MIVEKKNIIKMIKHTHSLQINNSDLKKKLSSAIFPFCSKEFIIQSKDPEM